jgi:hypothetical protein
VELRYVYGNTKKEALAKLADMQKRHEAGIPAGSTTLTVEMYLLEWLEHMKHRVRLMVDSMRSTEMSPRMVQWVHSTLRNALQHAFAEDLVARNVAKGVRIENPAQLIVIDPFSADEASTFLVRVREHRLYALWVLVLMLGLRRS